jgi:CBS domain-containing protein
MITATDIANHQSANSAYLAADVRKAKSVGDLIEVSKRLPSLHVRLATASVTARHIGEAVSCLTDAITGRLLEMAEAELGPPPVPYAWMAGGSQARHEQSSHSDQDNALLLSDDFDTDEHGGYFAALAKFVSDGLNECGFVYCPGDAMATNPEWRQPLKVWQGYFTRWIESPTPMSMMLSSIFFDLRPVIGAVELFLPLQKMILKKSRRNRIFLAHMMANAMQHRPPLGFFRQFVLERGGEHDETLDLKHRGIVPITDIARLLALSLGKEPVNTVERLRACAGTPVLSSDMAENLEDALEFIASLRIRHQADQIRRGKQPDNYVSPEELSELERWHLKQAFQVIQDMQETMVKRFGADNLG